MGNVSWVSGFRSFLKKRGNAGDITGELQCCVVDVQRSVPNVLFSCVCLREREKIFEWYYICGAVYLCQL